MVMSRYILLVFFVFSLFALKTFAYGFDGCYKSLEINGRNVVSGPVPASEQSSVFTLAANEFYYDLETRSPLRTKVISLFTGFREGWKSFVNPLVFEELGEFQTDANSLRYFFEGEVYHRNRHYGLDKVDFKTAVELYKYKGIISGSIFQNSKALNRRTKVSIVLREVPCD